MGKYGCEMYSESEVTLILTEKINQKQKERHTYVGEGCG
jgi:hypothetical protein